MIVMPDRDLFFELWSNGILNKINKLPIIMRIPLLILFFIFVFIMYLPIWVLFFIFH